MRHERTRIKKRSTRVGHVHKIISCALSVEILAKLSAWILTSCGPAWPTKKVRSRLWRRYDLAGVDVRPGFGVNHLLGRSFVGVLSPSNTFNSTFLSGQLGTPCWRELYLGRPEGNDCPCQFTVPAVEQHFWPGVRLYQAALHFRLARCVPPTLGQLRHAVR